MSSSTVTNNGQSWSKMRPTLTLNNPDVILVPWNGSPAHPFTVQHSATFLSGLSGWNKSTSSLFAQSPWSHKQRGHGRGLARLKISHKIEFPRNFNVDVPCICGKSYITCALRWHWRSIPVQRPRKFWVSCHCSAAAFFLRPSNILHPTFHASTVSNNIFSNATPQTSSWISLSRSLSLGAM
jgi:hypothetical protein